MTIALSTADCLDEATAAGSALVQLTGVVDGVRLGAHGVGGLWAIGLSVFAIRTRMLPVVIGWLGIAVGAMRGANLFVPALANVRSLTMPARRVVLGAAVARAQATPAPGPLPHAAAA